MRMKKRKNVVETDYNMKIKIMTVYLERRPNHKTDRQREREREESFRRRESEKEIKRERDKEIKR